MVPPKVPEPPLEPVVSMTAAVELLVSEPVPARPSMAMTRPLRSSVPALPILRVLAAESAVSLPRVTVPPEMVVAPLKVLFPESVSVPVPVLVRPMVPRPSWMFPVKAAVWSLAPAVKMAAPELLVTRPEPASPLVVRSKPLRSRMPGVASERLPL